MVSSTTLGHGQVGCHTLHLTKPTSLLSSTVHLRQMWRRVKAKYDGPFRGLWTVEEGNYLVGTDAEGIQLRILADLMESQEYIDAIITGKKEDETDIHNLNRKALGLPHITRDMAKTFHLCLPARCRD